MVMDSVGEFDLFEIFFEPAELRVVAVTFVIGIDIFEKIANGQIVAAVLIPEDVAACQSGLGQIVDEETLSLRQVFEAGDIVAQNFDVGEAVDDLIVERLLRGLADGGAGNGGQ